MSSLFDELEADAIVKAVMLLHNKEVIIIKKGNNPMKVVLYKDDDGQIKRAVNFEEISRDEIEDKINELEKELGMWQEALASFDLLKSESQATVEQAPIEEPKVEQPEASQAQPETPAQPEQPTTPTDQPPSQPEAPAQEQPPVAAPIVVS